MKKFFILLLLLSNQFLFSQSFKNTIYNFVNPLPEKYVIASSYQMLRDSINIEGVGSTNSAWHNGIDMPCPEGTSVYAAKAGIVKCVYPGYYNGEKFKGHPTYGGLIIIYHYDKTITLYAHLSCTNVKENQKVEQGEKIGLSGGVMGKRASGTSTGPHLHFSIYIDIINFINIQ